MGRAMRWFKALFGLKGGKDQKGTPKSSNRCLGSSAYPCHNPSTIPPNITAAEAAWLRSFAVETEKEQNKHAVANAAVAATWRTSHGRGITLSGSITQKLAAVKIQTTFRGFLAKKALKALKGLVKLQALVRGFLVRKQANATLLGIEALIRAQSIVRAQKFQGHYQNYDHFRHNYGVRKWPGRCDDSRSEYKATIHSRSISSSFNATKDLFVEKQMFAEADLAQPKSRSIMLNESISKRNEDLYCPVHYEKPVRISTPDGWNYRDKDWPHTGDECQLAMALSTPRFVNGPGRFANGPNGPGTPTDSVCGIDVLRSYMVDTQSFKAKQRSKSAPRQRPDIRPKKRVTLNELMESRKSHSGARMERCCSQAQDVVTFKNVVMGKLERSCDFASNGQHMI